MGGEWIKDRWVDGGGEGGLSNNVDTTDLEVYGNNL